MSSDFEDIVKEFLLHWNNKDVESCVELMAPEVEMRSTLAYKLIPQSNGVIKGRETLTKYFELLMERFPEFVLDNVEFKFLKDSIIVKSLSPTGKYTFHVQYFINSNNKIYLLKSDTTEV